MSQAGALGSGGSGGGGITSVAGSTGGPQTGPAISLVGAGGITTSGTGNTITITGGSPDPSQTLNYVNDFIEDTTDWQLGTQLGGTIFFGSLDQDHPGVAYLNIDNQDGSASWMNINQAGSIIAGGGEIDLEIVANMGLSTSGGEVYDLILGYGYTNPSSPSNGQGAYFEAKTGVNSGLITCNVGSFGTTAFTVNTTAPADGTWANYKIQINAAGTSVDFLINNVTVATITDPTVLTYVSIPGGPCFGVYHITNNGDDGSAIFVDLVKLTINLTNPR